MRKAPDLTEFWQQLDGPRWPPEYRLVIAILQRAVLDLTDTKATQRVRDDAEGWIFAAETGPWSVWWIFETVFPDDPQPHYDRFIREMRDNPRRPVGMQFRVGKN